MITKYKIPRFLGYEEIFEPLVRLITGVQQSRVREGCYYENEYFKIKPHYYGDCHCEFGKNKREFEKKNPHSPQCFQNYLLEVDEAFRKHPKYSYALPLKTERINLIKSYCLKNNIEFKNTKDLYDICTCTVGKKWKELKYEHTEDCSIISPNFYHNKSNLKIWWYKVFFRNSYSNREINKKEFSEIISDCINNFRPKTL